MGYRTSFRNYVNRCTKMVSNDSQPPCAAYMIKNFDLAFDSQTKFKVKRRGTGCRPEITSASVPKWYQTIASLPEQLTRSRLLTWHSTFQVKFKVKGRVTRYCSEITSVRLPKWSQTIADRPGQLTRPKPDLTFALPGKIQGQRTSSRNYVSTFIKMISNDTQPP